jgi:nucleotide-binding universal stress UspA family protein
VKIVCGTDFSPCAKAAADVSAGLAGLTADTIVLAHAVDWAGIGPVMPSIIDALEAMARERLTAEAQRLRAMSVNVEEALLVGLPDEAILEKTSIDSTRLVVVGSLGHRDPKRWKLGSVSERIAERARIPTLVVREAKPFLAWTTRQRPLKVFLACDLADTSDCALRWLRNMQALGPCDIVLGHVDSPLEAKHRLGLTGSLSLVEILPEVQKELEHRLTEKAANFLRDVPSRVRVSPCLGSPDGGLIECAVEEKADLLVTGTHQIHGVARLWHHSVSRALLHYAPMNVVVVPPNLAPENSQPAPAG